MNFIEKQFGRLGNRLFQMAYLYSQFRDGIIPDFYLQSPKYFEKYADEIRQMFGEGIIKDDRIALHCRRGDYISNPFYVDLTQTNYYKDAIQEFLPNKFICFSDDQEWCKKHFIGYGSAIFNNMDFSEGKTVEEDLKLMAGCRGIIMANSSLSWWGSFLGDKNKKVI